MRAFFYLFTLVAFYVSIQLLFFLVCISFTWGYSDQHFFFFFLDHNQFDVMDEINMQKRVKHCRKCKGARVWKWKCSWWRRHRVPAPPFGRRPPRWQAGPRGTGRRRRTPTLKAHTPNHLTMSLLALHSHIGSYSFVWDHVLSSAWPVVYFHLSYTAPKWPRQTHQNEPHSPRHSFEFYFSIFFRPKFTSHRDNPFDERKQKGSSAPELGVCGESSPCLAPKAFFMAYRLASSWNLPMFFL